jgi:hypothetical protein
VSETDAGGEHTIDHYRPVTDDGDDSDDNLVYACFRCNNYKGDFFPTSDDVWHGRRILHPLLDSFAQHLREDEGSGLLQPLTDTGRFHLALMRLNRPQLVEYRLQRRLARLLEEDHRLLREENQALRRRIALLEQFLSLLRLQVVREAGGSEGEVSDGS